MNIEEVFEKLKLVNTTGIIWTGDNIEDIKEFLGSPNVASWDSVLFISEADGVNTFEIESGEALLKDEYDVLYAYDPRVGVILKLGFRSKIRSVLPVIYRKALDGQANVL